MTRRRVPGPRGPSGTAGAPGPPGPTGPAGPNAEALFAINNTLAAQLFWGWGVQSANATEVLRQFPAPWTGTARNLRMRTTAGNIGVAALIGTFRVAGVASSLTASIAAGSASASDLVNVASFNAGDLLSFDSPGNSATCPSNVWATIELYKS